MILSSHSRCFVWPMIAVGNQIPIVKAPVGELESVVLSLFQMAIFDVYKKSLARKVPKAGARKATTRLHLLHVELGGGTEDAQGQNLWIRQHLQPTPPRPSDTAASGPPCNFLTFPVLTFPVYHPTTPTPPPSSILRLPPPKEISPTVPSYPHHHHHHHHHLKTTDQHPPPPRHSGLTNNTTPKRERPVPLKELRAVVALHYRGLHAVLHGRERYRAPAALTLNYNPVERIQ